MLTAPSENAFAVEGGDALSDSAIESWARVLLDLVEREADAPPHRPEAAA